MTSSRSIEPMSIVQYFMGDPMLGFEVPEPHETLNPTSLAAARRLAHISPTTANVIAHR